MSEDIYQLYLDEVEAIPPYDTTESAALSVSLSARDELAKERLAEENLKTAFIHTKEYLNRGMIVSDLIQKVNMALILAMESYGAPAVARMAETGMEGQKVHLVKGVFEQYLGPKIREVLDAAIEAQAAESEVEGEMLTRVSVMKDISQTMAEELGRDATVEELAERLEMTVEEVKDIMKLTLNAMTLNGEYEEWTSISSATDRSTGVQRERYRETQIFP